MLTRLYSAALLLGSLAFALACSSGTGPGDSGGVSFEKHQVTDAFVAEGVHVADVDRDGTPDVIAGSHWYEAPDWTAHAFRPVKTFPDTTWGDSFLNHAADVDGDGWVDVIRIGFPGDGFYWYENPGNPGETDESWTRRMVHPTINNEASRFVDVNGDGREDLLFADGETGQVAWYEIDRSSPEDTVFWRRHPISEPGSPGTSRFYHGFGFGDLNADGRRDVFVLEGWWEAPEDRTDSAWTFHEADFGEAAAQMHTYDFDGDGDRDVVSSSAHDYGIWWHERIAPPEADSSWATHRITDSFSQTHALLHRDVDEDGDPDLITGKRYFAHNGKDPGGTEPAVLYWLEYERGADGHSWIPHRIDSTSGIGVEFEYEHVIGDERPDIVTANKHGVFVFERGS